MDEEKKESMALSVACGQSMDIQDCDCFNAHPAWMKTSCCAKMLWPIYMLVQLANFVAYILMIMQGEEQTEMMEEYLDKNNQIVTPTGGDIPCTDAASLSEYMRLMGIWGLCWTVAAPGVAICFACDDTAKQNMPGVKRCVSLMGCVFTLALGAWGSSIVFALNEVNDCSKQLVDFNTYYLYAFWGYIGFSFVLLPVIFAIVIAKRRAYAAAHPQSHSSLKVIPQGAANVLE